LQCDSGYKTGLRRGEKPIMVAIIGAPDPAIMSLKTQI